MTIIPRNALSTLEFNQLGNNLDDPPEDHHPDDYPRDQDQVDAMNRSLATLGEELDEQVQAAIRCEHTAS